MLASHRARERPRIHVRSGPVHALRFSVGSIRRIAGRAEGRSAAELILSLADGRAGAFSLRRKIICDPGGGRIATRAKCL